MPEDDLHQTEENAGLAQLVKLVRVPGSVLKLSGRPGRESLDIGLKGHYNQHCPGFRPGFSPKLQSSTH